MKKKATQPMLLEQERMELALHLLLRHKRANKGHKAYATPSFLQRCFIYQRENRGKIGVTYVGAQNVLNRLERQGILKRDNQAGWFEIVRSRADKAPSADTARQLRRIKREMDANAQPGARLQRALVSWLNESVQGGYDSETFSETGHSFKTAGCNGSVYYWELYKNGEKISEKTVDVRELMSKKSAA